MGAGSTSYQEVVSPDDYKNINPLGNAEFQNLFGNLSNFTRGLEGNTSTDPSSAINQFLGLMPQFQNQIASASSDLGTGLRNQMQSMVDQSTSQVGNELSKLGAVYSGAFADIASRNAAEIGGNFANQLLGQQLGLYGSFGNTALQGLLSGQQGNLNALTNLYGLQSGLATPTMVAPTMAAEYNPSFGEQIMPWLNLGLNAFGMGGGGGFNLGGGGGSAATLSPVDPNFWRTQYK